MIYKILIRAVIKSWKLWMAVPIVAVGLVIFLTRDLEKRYITNARIYVNLQTDGSTSVSGASVKQFEIGIYFDNMIELLKSRNSIEKVRLRILKEALEGKHDFIDFEGYENLKDNDSINHRIEELSVKDQQLDLRNNIDNQIHNLLEDNRCSFEELTENLKVSKIGKSNFLTLTIESENPYKCVYLLELYIDTLINQNKTLGRERISNNRRMIERLLNDSKAKLDEKIKNLESFKIENNIINLGEHTKAIVTQIVNMEVKLVHLKESQAANNEALTHILETLQKDNPGPLEFSNNLRVLSLKDSLVALNADLVINEFTDKEAELKNKKIMILKDRLQTEVVGMLGNTPYDPSTIRQELVNKYITHQIQLEIEKETVPIVEREMQNLVDYAATFAPLESQVSTFDREILIAQEGYLMLLNKFNLAKSIEESTGENEIRLIDSPLLPIKPESTKRAFMVIGAGMGCFVLTITFVILFTLFKMNKDLIVTLFKDEAEATENAEEEGEVENENITGEGDSSSDSSET
ncbi:GumC family protein [Sediminitomix flava]|uniref:Uncharacterized protein involved in exopolysaccharide biosynthesis n=1 Tax=Sediminitomix flava TaxID=379075 RepID=A0A315Z5G0_SEDFL|nr:Wzz/FepE/Etk N-terminal domain-containing protein [Sediminitomix flava]PWJ38507.1 uncharacterized protein involved in exopolysaccharide biosynthesis [Sediminitomix flava]